MKTDTARNDWPPEMEIRVAVNEDHIIELLYIRSAWRLSTSVDLPALSRVPAPGSSSAPSYKSIEQWSIDWCLMWDAAWEWSFSHRVGRREGIEKLFTTIGAPPRWSDVYGTEGFDSEAYSNWANSLRTTPPVRATSPERAALQAVVSAWTRGLDTCYVLPFAGFYVEQNTSNSLVVSAETRENAPDYAQALSSFVRF